MNIATYSDEAFTREQLEENLEKSRANLLRQFADKFEVYNRTDVVLPDGRYYAHVIEVDYTS